jgi:hypothetical protein
MIKKEKIFDSIVFVEYWTEPRTERRNEAQSGLKSWYQNISSKPFLIRLSPLSLPPQLVLLKFRYAEMRNPPTGGLGDQVKSLNAK